MAINSIGQPSKKKGVSHRRGPITKEWLMQFGITNPATGCIEWTRRRSSAGYGTVTENKIKTQVPRVAYRIWFGEFEQSLEVMHRCDNPACFNPDHLRLGTHLDNMSDMSQKGRSYKGGFSGETNGRAKLTWEKVETIRNLRKSGEFPTSIARQFGVSVGIVKGILNNIYWVKKTLCHD